MHICNTLYSMHFNNMLPHIFSYDFINMEKTFPSSCLSFAPEIHFCCESLLTALLSFHSPDSGCFLTLNPSEEEAFKTVTSDALCSSVGLAQGRLRHRRAAMGTQSNAGYQLAMVLSCTCSLL